MKRNAYYFSFLVDFVSILLILLHVFQTNVTVDRVFLVIYLVFISLFVFDKFNREKLKKGLDEYKLGSISNKLYYFALLGAILTDVFLIYLQVEKTNLPNAIVVLVLFYFICLTNYDVDTIYYDKKHMLYSNRVIELDGIKLLDKSSRFFVNKLAIYYVKREPLYINTFNKEKAEKIHNFIKEKISPKRKKR